MKKLIAVLMALCLLGTAAALAEETPTLDSMPAIVTVDEGVELTDADFEGDWVADTVFLNGTYMTEEELIENGIQLRPMRIADGKVINVIIDGEGEHETSVDYTLDSNQIQFSDGEGVEAVFDKLADGNVVLNIFLPGEGDVVNDLSVYMVHPEVNDMMAMPAVITVDEGVELTDADFEGEWIADKVFLNGTALTAEQVEEYGLSVRPMRIADGKVYSVTIDDEGEHETSVDYTLDSNQIQFSDGEGVEAVFDKLADGNVVLNIFLPGEGDVVNDLSVYMVHPAE